MLKENEQRCDSDGKPTRRYARQKLVDADPNSERNYARPHPFGTMCVRSPARFGTPGIGSQDPFQRTKANVRVFARSQRRGRAGTVDGMILQAAARTLVQCFV
jgi:hypothetical protein